MDARDRLIVALDHATAEAAVRQVDELGDAVTRYKVGLELYLATGRAFVARLNGMGKKVFLDLKLHDIPETVKRAATVVSDLGADLLTVHASGGRAMLQAAVSGAGAQTRVLAVTVLTSLDAGDLAADGNPLPVQDLVVRRALLARDAGCAGVVASPHEAAAIRAQLPAPFLIVTPGVRLAAADDDQKRVATPAAALKAGADAVVVGRPIRDAQDRRAAAEQLVRELT